MANNNMKAKIKERIEIAEGTIMVKFDILGKKINFIPGQYFFITLINPPYTDKRGNVRHFTIVNSPKEKRIITMATRVRDTAFKKSLNEMPIGSEVQIENILGDFNLPDDESTPLIFIAGGIGITPYISMLRHIKDNNLNYNITLIYSNCNRESSAFFDELRELEKEIKNFKLILIMSDDHKWKGEKRMIDADFIKEYFPEFKDKTYYISGPPPMVEAVSKVLSEIGINSDNIKKENFSGY